jgi:hypothetical protein
MDCLEAQAILSAAHDGEQIEPTDVAAAQAHAAECDDCARFAEGLRYLDVMPAPGTPPDVLDATLAAVAVAAEERAEARRFEALHLEAAAQAAELAAAEPEAAAAPEPAVGVRFPWLTSNVKWAAIGAIGAVAATALIAFVIAGNGAGPTGGAKTATSEANQSTSAPNFAFSGKSAAAGAPSTASNPAPSTAPDYVVYNSLVFSPGALLADSSTATPTIGAVSTAFASSGAPQSALVFASPLSDGSIVVQGPDGDRLYEPVVRLLQSKRYQLAAGNDVDRFGTWPALPVRFTTPTSSDGSPVFTAAGVDALNVRVYAAVGQPVTAGFAIAPGTSTSDPAGGNPNWTWWQPVTQ